jgi:ubiquinone/menaquinone biosynthesis C-methylase UbiE
MSANFDPLARIYRYLEWAAFGPALWRRRVAFLPQLQTAQSVLMPGEGDGRFLAKFLQSNPTAKVDYIDSSPRMLALARARGEADRVNFRVADLLTFEPTTRYDAITTHFFLDCFTDAELAHLVPKLARFLNPGGLWIVSEFQHVPPGLYQFFGLTTGLRPRQIPDYRRALTQAGLIQTAVQPGLGGMLVSELWVHPL